MQTSKQWGRLFNGLPKRHRDTFTKWARHNSGQPWEYLREAANVMSQSARHEMARR